MKKGYIKASYAVLYNPVTKKEFFSIQKADTGNNPFCYIEGNENKIGDLVLVSLNQDCIDFFVSKATKSVMLPNGLEIKPAKNGYDEILQYLSKNNLVGVKEYSVTFVDVVSKSKTDFNPKFPTVEVVDGKTVIIPDEEEPEPELPEKKEKSVIWLLLAGLLALL